MRQNNLNRLLFFPLFLSSLTISGCSMQKQACVPDEKKTSTKEVLDTYTVWAALPINAVVSPKIFLSIHIPHTFRMVGDDWSAHMNEYIPKSDAGPDAWSEIITTQIYLGQKWSARKVADAIMNSIKSAGAGSDGSPVATLEDSAEDNKDYSMASFALLYTNHKIDHKREEVVFAKYYSGPYDCIGFQYAIALSPEMTQAKAMEKIKAFVEANVFLQQGETRVTQK